MKLSGKISDGLLYAGAFAANNLFKAAEGPYGELFTSYGADVALPFGAYYLGKLINLPKIANEWVNAAAGFVGCSLFEVGQGLGLYEGTFDPKDFIAYAAGTGLAIGIDKLINRKRKENPETFSVVRDSV